jgi:hypothetical protein
MYFVVDPITAVGAAVESVGEVMGAADCAKWYAFSSEDELNPANFDLMLIAFISLSTQWSGRSSNVGGGVCESSLFASSSSS